MTKCSHCKKEIIGNVKERVIFVPPAIVIPQSYCDECWIIVQEKEQKLLPLVVVILGVFLILICILFLIYFD